MTVRELIQRLQQVNPALLDAPVRTQGWDDMGNLQDFALRGDLRLERDAVGNPIVVLR